MTSGTVESQSGAPRVRLTRAGLVLGERELPLLAGAVHYWRLDPRHWRSALEGVRDLGLVLVDTYVPWSVHEVAPGEFDLTDGKPGLDVVRFLALAQEVGLHAIVRPGPHVNAELTGFGIPERVLWDDACQARSPSGRRVVLPAPPLAFPVPSHASEAFFAAVSEWYGAVGRVLGPSCWPNGPIVLVQVDNEAALYFRDGVYDQDHHPDAVEHHRAFLRSRYRTDDRLRAAHRAPTASLDTIRPPVRRDDDRRDLLRPHLDWALSQDVLVADSLRRFAEALRVSGFSTVPFVHNLPPAESATPLDPARVAATVDVVGIDCYHVASPSQRGEIARRVSAVAERCRAAGVPAFSCELGAGCVPFLPPLDDADNAFAALTALAYGLRGFNAYMAVDRDRWIGAPLDRRGRRRPSAEFWERLAGAVQRTAFPTLVRETPVHVVVPRVVRHLERVSHAFGPLSAAALRLAGVGPDVGSFDEGFAASVARETHQLVRALEAALDERGVAYAEVQGDLVEHSLRVARWVVVASGAVADRHVLRAVRRSPEVPVSFGPGSPAWSEDLDPLDEPPPSPRAGVPPVLSAHEVQSVVARAIDALALPTFRPSVPEAHAALHVDAEGRPAVVFVMNPTRMALECTVPAVGATRAADALHGARIDVASGVLHVRLEARTARMIELGGAPSR